MDTDLIIRWGFPDTHRIRAQGSCSLLIVVSQTRTAVVRRRSLKGLTQTLGRSALVEVVNCGANHDTLAGLVNSESANLDMVLVLDRLYERRLTDDLYELFTSISVLVDLKDIARSHRLVQGDVNGQVNAAEPGGAKLLSVSGHEEERGIN